MAGSTSPRPVDRVDAGADDYDLDLAGPRLRLRNLPKHQLIDASKPDQDRSLHEKGLAHRFADFKAKRQPIQPPRPCSLATAAFLASARGAAAGAASRSAYAVNVGVASSSLNRSRYLTAPPKMQSAI